jgi:crotonobetainyl-CoA:carnitine CoA-transferase CaiB-like acyl-CoA transferase
LTTEIAGPYATKLLADAGADVVKVEPPEGDPLRRWSASGATIRPDEDGALFRFLNTSKRSIVIDCRAPAGRGAVLDLVRGADLVLESLGAGVIEALGLGPKAFLRANPRVALVSISSFGRGGPWSERVATEFTLQAWCGSTASRGTLDRPPVSAGGRLGEWMGGAFAALGAVTALRHARQTGHGEHLDLSLLEVMCMTMAPNLALYESLAGRPNPISRSLEIPSIEPARDGFVGFCTITAQQWRDFLVLIDRPDLVDDADLAHWLGRTLRVEEVNRLIHAWTRERTVDEIIERASQLRIPVAPIGTGATVSGFDHFVARGSFVANPGGGFVQPRPPYRLSAAPLRPLERAPRLGEHAGDLSMHERGTGGAHEIGSARAVGGSTQGAPTPSDSAVGHTRLDRTPRGDGARHESLPLAGLRIIDFTAFWAGPFATHFLATMGAEVIKIESIQRPDGMRFASTQPPSADRWWEWGALFQATNLGKRSVTLDLNRPRGRELAIELIKRSDAVVENFSPRVMDNLGIEYTALARTHPGLIMVRMPAFGLDGPWRDRVGFAQTMEQISGMAWITGFADRAPIIPRGPCDPLAGIHAAFALLLALEHRRRTGEGQLVEVTMVEAALNAAAELVVEHSAYGALLSRDGNRGPLAAPQNVYACRGDERWLALAIVTDDHWRALCALLGDPSWASAPELSTGAGRRAAHALIDRELATWLAERDRDATVGEMLERGIPAAPVLSARESERNPQLLARGFFQAVGHPVVGTHFHTGLPLRDPVCGRSWYSRPAPTLGQHSRQVLREILALSESELDELEATQVIGERPLGA